MSKITIKRSVVEQVLLALRTDDLSLVRESVIALRAALEQLQDQPEQRLDMVPAGWKLVPSTLTDTQRQAALDAWWNACDGEMYWKTVYAAMLAAAPQPPVVEQPQSVTDCHQSQPQGEQEPNSKWPSNASEVRAFLSGRVATERYARDDHQPDDNDTYTLSAHDLLEAIDWWTDFDPQPPRQPLTDEQIEDIDGEILKQGHSESHTGMLAFARAIERAHGIGGDA